MSITTDNYLKHVEKKQLDWAKQWRDYQVKNRIYSELVFVDMTDDELVAFAKKESLRGEDYWNHRDL